MSLVLCVRQPRIDKLPEAVRRQDLAYLARALEMDITDLLSYDEETKSTGNQRGVDAHENSTRYLSLSYDRLRHLPNGKTVGHQGCLQPMAKLLQNRADAHQSSSKQDDPPGGRATRLRFGRQHTRSTND